MSEQYKKLSRPPASALKRIDGGRLKGMTDIKPQWRYEVMDEVFGACGIGWKYEIVRLWTEQGSEGQLMSHASVNVYTKQGDTWSDPIPGVGGSMLVEMEKTGLHTNDEGYKMAITDALSTALKMLGVAADVHMGLWDGSKYKDEQPAPQSAPDKPNPSEIATLKTALIDFQSAGVFDESEARRLAVVMAANDIPAMRKALDVAKKRNAER